MKVVMTMDDNVKTVTQIKVRNSEEFKVKVGFIRD